MNLTHEKIEGIDYITISDYPEIGESTILEIKQTVGRGGGPYTYTFPEKFSFRDLMNNQVFFTSKGKVETVRKNMKTLLTIRKDRKVNSKAEAKKRACIKAVKQKYLSKL
jgi:hypothetical protein